MIKNFFKLIANEFSLMIKGSIFTFVLFCLLMIASSIFSLALRHVTFDIEIPLAFLWIMIFFISLIKVEKVYASDFSEAKLQQYILSPFALETTGGHGASTATVYLLFAKGHLGKFLPFLEGLV